MELVLTPSFYGKGGRYGENDISIEYFTDKFIRPNSGIPKAGFKKVVELIKKTFILLYMVEFRKKPSIPDNDLIILF